MANYNHARYLKESLGAILSQSYRPLEIIIIDDGSTDNSVSLIQELCAGHDHVRLVQHKENRGFTETAKHMLELAVGDYVYGAAADDYILPGFFEASMACLAHHPEAGFCFTDIDRQDERCNRRYNCALKIRKDPCFLSPKDMERVFCLGISTNSAIYKRSAFLEMGGWIPDLKWQSDWFALLVLGLRYGACYVPKTLARLRVIDSSYSAMGRREEHRVKEILRREFFLLKSPDFLDIYPRIKRTSAYAVYGFITLKMIRKTGFWEFCSWRLVLQTLIVEFYKRFYWLVPHSRLIFLKKVMFYY